MQCRFQGWNETIADTKCIIGLTYFALKWLSLVCVWCLTFICFYNIVFHLILCMKLALARWFDSRISVRGSRKYAVVYREADERDVSDSAHLSSCVCVWKSVKTAKTLTRVHAPVDICLYSLAILDTYKTRVLLKTSTQNTRFQASAAKYTRSALSWDITQRAVVILFWRFFLDFLILEVGTGR